MSVFDYRYDEVYFMCLHDVKTDKFYVLGMNLEFMFVLSGTWNIEHSYHVDIKAFPRHLRWRCFIETKVYLLAKYYFADSYTNIASPDYHGDISSIQIEHLLEELGLNSYDALLKKHCVEQVAEKKATKKEPPEIVCVNNFGLEIYFDKEVSYLYKHSDNNDFLIVMDKFGEWREVLAKRFNSC